MLTAGAWTAGLLAALGVKLELETRPLQMLLTEPAPAGLGPVVGAFDRRLSLKQLADGAFLIGGGWPATLAGADEHPTVELDSLIGSLSLAQHVIPRIGALRLIRTWAGVNTSVDGRPVVGPVRGLPGLFFAIPGDAGYTLGPLTARLVADTMLGRMPEAPIGGYTADRFN